jgi:membrane associated rhomboid family serine protease
MSRCFSPRFSPAHHFAEEASDAVLRGRVWQIVTYMFLHGSVGHLLFNMLALWMFGTKLERIWGTARSCGAT